MIAFNPIGSARRPVRRTHPVLIRGVIGAAMALWIVGSACDGEGGVVDLSGIPETLRFEPRTLTISVGEAVQLEAEIQDANGDVVEVPITFTSSDPLVVTISPSALVEGVGVGQATVTAQAGEFTATATITVTPIPVASVEVSPATASLVEGTQQQLTAAVLDAGGTVLSDRELSWSSSNDGIASVDGSGLVTALAVGNATLQDMPRTEGWSCWHAAQEESACVLMESPRVEGSMD